MLLMLFVDVSDLMNGLWYVAIVYVLCCVDAIELI